MKNTTSLKLALLIVLVAGVKAYSQFGQMPDKACYNFNLFGLTYRAPFYFLTDNSTIFRYSNLGGSSPQLSTYYYLCRSTDENLTTSSFLEGVGGLECCSNKQILPVNDNKVVYALISLLNTKINQRTNGVTSTIFSVLGWETNFTATENNAYCLWKKNTLSGTSSLFLERQINNVNYSDTLNYDNIINVPEITFVNDSTGYIFGQDTANNFTLIRTDDYGANWNNVLNPAKEITDIKFDGPIGYLVGDGGMIYQTIDNGLNWNQISSFTTKKLNSVSVKNLKCYVAGDSASLFHSLNFGLTWLQDTLTIPNSSNVDWVKVTNADEIFFQSNNKLYKNDQYTSVSETRKEDGGLMVYPSPTNDVINVKFLAETSGKYTISIFNMLGEEVYKTEEKGPIEVKRFASGLYSVVITTSKKEIYRRSFVKMN